MLTRWIVAAGLAAAVAAGNGLGADDAQRPSTDDAQTRPAERGTEIEALDPAVEAILDRLEKRELRDIEANVEYVKTDVLLNDRQKYDGVLRYRAQEPNPVFFIRFDKRTQNSIIRREKEWHVFDGRWYWEARERTSQITKREIVSPDDEQEVFRLGEGPFPLPFGQKKADILRHFTVRLISPADRAPGGFVGDHLELTPRPGTEMDRRYQAIHFYIDRELDLPIRVRTTDKEEDRELLVTFTNVEPNKGLREDQLRLPRLDYTVIEEPLRRPAEARRPGPPGHPR